MKRREMGGRPRQFDGTVSVRLPAPLHDALAREAVQRGVELSQVIRERLSTQPAVSYLKTRQGGSESVP